jgi:hypothetical protein
MTKFHVENFGQIKEATIEFGDLTIFIGPQASGKTILLQLFKFVNDYSYIATTLKRFGFTYNREQNTFLRLYFGENMNNLWNTTTRVLKNGKPFNLSSIVKKFRSGSKQSKEKLFYIPAQRVVILGDGWPKPFMSFKMGDPFIIKNFSEHLRLLMEAGLGTGRNRIFPQPNRLKSIYRKVLNQSIFHGARVELDQESNQRRFVLNLNDNKLPYMNWSAGQREFLPLLLGLYWFIPSSGSSLKNRKWDSIHKRSLLFC